MRPSLAVVSYSTQATLFFSFFMSDTSQPPTSLAFDELDSDDAQALCARIHEVQTRINQSANAAGRNQQEVTLLAASKTRPAADLRAAWHCGQRCFGENYLQEAVDKVRDLADLDIDWHFIGPIQSNKTRDIAAHFHWVHGVDRVKIARRLNDHRPAGMPPLNICLQVNISEEPNKSGLLLEDLAGVAEQISGFSHLKFRGLMAIPVKTTDPAQQAQAFAALRDAMNDLIQSGYQLDTLSMGMSGDMQAAIAEGSTMVRIGTAVFGARLPRPMDNRGH